jgi:hypothetical protein
VRRREPLRCWARTSTAAKQHRWSFLCAIGTSGETYRAVTTDELRIRLPALPRRTRRRLPSPSFPVRGIPSTALVTGLKPLPQPVVRCPRSPQQPSEPQSKGRPARPDSQATRASPSGPIRGGWSTLTGGAIAGSVSVLWTITSVHHWADLDAAPGRGEAGVEPCGAPGGHRTPNPGRCPRPRQPQRDHEHATRDYRPLPRTRLHRCRGRSSPKRVREGAESDGANPVSRSATVERKRLIKLGDSVPVSRPPGVRQRRPGGAYSCPGVFAGVAPSGAALPGASGALMLRAFGDMACLGAPFGFGPRERISPGGRAGLRVLLHDAE